MNWEFTIGLEKEEKRFSPTVARNSKRCKKALNRTERRTERRSLTLLPEDEKQAIDVKYTVQANAPLTMYVNGRIQPCK